MVDGNSQHAERIAVLEIKMDTMQKTLDEAVEELKSVHDMLQQSRGAARFASWTAGFLGMATAAAISAKLAVFYHWLGR